MTFEPKDECELSDYLPGQHGDIKVPIGGDIVRSYSLTPVMLSVCPDSRFSITTPRHFLPICSAVILTVAIESPWPLCRAT